MSALKDSLKANKDPIPVTLDTSHWLMWPYVASASMAFETHAFTATLILIWSIGVSAIVARRSMQKATNSPNGLDGATVGSRPCLWLFFCVNFAVFVLVAVAAGATCLLVFTFLLVVPVEETVVDRMVVELVAGNSVSKTC
jgi:hypothetical protein